MPDGSVVSSYFNLEKKQTGRDVKAQGIKTLIGQVEKVHFTDEGTNVSKKFVEYDVIVRDERGGQTTYKNVRCEAMLGGSNDFEETILEPNEVAFSGKLDSSNLFANKNGALVYVSFRDGSLDKPYIEACVAHPKKIGAKKADGIRKIGEFRGLEWNINKDGELTITYNGNRSADGKLVRKDTGPTKIKIDKTGGLTISDNKGQVIEMKRTTKTIKLSNGVTLILDGEADKVSLELTGGVKLTIDGEGDSVKVETAGGAKLTVDGSAGEISAQDNGEGKLKISDGKVGLGTASNELVDLVKQIADALSAATYPGFGAPASNVADYGIISGKLGQIKGGV